MVENGFVFVWAAISNIIGINYYIKTYGYVGDVLSPAAIQENLVKHGLPVFLFFTLFVPIVCALITITSYNLKTVWRNRKERRVQTQHQEKEKEKSSND